MDIDSLLLTPDEINQIFLTHFAKQYGEDAARQLLEQLPDCAYAKDIAQAQLDKIQKSLKPKQMEAVGMVFGRIEKLKSPSFREWVWLSDLQSLKAEILDKIGGE